MVSQSCFNFHFPITEESLGINSDIFCCLLPKSFGGFNFFLLICRSFFLICIYSRDYSIAHCMFCKYIFPKFIF